MNREFWADLLVSLWLPIALGALWVVLELLAYLRRQ